jgi:hypothetical protein
MNVGALISVKGFVTQEKYILGRNLNEIEDILGFNKTRLSQGVVIAALLRLPNPGDFQLAGYSQVAAHHTAEQYGRNLEGKFDINVLTKNLQQEVWSLYNSNRLIKVMPVAQHNNLMTDDEQYPPGQGVPQWKLVNPISAKVIAAINDYPYSRYRIMNMNN